MTAADLSSRLHGVKKRGEWFNAKCPGHNDQRASLGFRDGSRGVIVKCHAGCTVEAIAHALGLNVRDFFHRSRLRSGRSSTTTRRIVATYPYCDEDGHLQYEVVRMDPKDFRQRRPDGKGGWIWKLGTVRRVLYRLPELRGRDTVFLVEGEKDADRLWCLGLSATTNAGGAGKWKATYVEQLQQAGVQQVVIIPDNDRPGQQHAQQVARSCRRASGSSGALPATSAT